MCIARGEACYIAYRVGYEPYPKRRGPAEPHKFEGPRTYPGHTVWQTATTFYMIKLEMTQVDLNSNIDIITYAPYYTASLVHWVCIGPPTLPFITGIRYFCIYRTFIHLIFQYSRTTSVNRYENVKPSCIWVLPQEVMEVATLSTGTGTCNVPVKSSP